jgi:hypothetical protein
MNLEELKIILPLELPHDNSTVKPLGTLNSSFRLDLKYFESKIKEFLNYKEPPPETLDLGCHLVSWHPFKGVLAIEHSQSCVLIYSINNDGFFKLTQPGFQLLLEVYRIKNKLELLAWRGTLLLQARWLLDKKAVSVCGELFMMLTSKESLLMMDLCPCFLKIRTGIRKAGCSF